MKNRNFVQSWESAIEAATGVYREFFAQGDLETARGMKPMVMMNRKVAIVPDLQATFVEKIACPVFR